MRTTRLLALSLGMATILLASGCRIPPSGVIQAGEPANGLRSTVTLYLVDQGALRMITRSADGVTGVAAAVETVAAGPTKTEWQSGLTTELPLPMPAPEVQVRGNLVTIRLQPGFKRISRTAVDQLACTAAAAWQLNSSAQDGTDVRVTVASAAGATADKGATDGPPAAAVAGAPGWQISRDGANCPVRPEPARSTPVGAPPGGAATSGMYTRPPAQGLSSPGTPRGAR